jgi:hypothetical protein
MQWMPHLSVFKRAAAVQDMYLPLSADVHSRTQVLNLDPPILVVDDFVSEDLCDQLVEAVESCGQLSRSRLGGGLSSDESMPISDRRTSTSLLIGPGQSDDKHIQVWHHPPSACRAPLDN